MVSTLTLSKHYTQALRCLRLQTLLPQLARCAKNSAMGERQAWCTCPRFSSEDEHVCSGRQGAKSNALKKQYVYAWHKLVNLVAVFQQSLQALTHAGGNHLVNLA